jgi:glycosyltransferase involved in cell wall biosynthesis
MKVLFVTSLERGGPVEQTLVLAARLAHRGVAVRAVCSTEAVAARFSTVGVHADVLPLRPGFDLAGAASLRREMAKADVVHAEDRRSGLWTRLAPRTNGGVRVYTVHGLPDPYMPAPLGCDRPAMRDRLAYEGLDAILCRRADAVIIPSATLAAVFRHRLGFPAGRLRVVPNGVDLVEPISARGQEVGAISLLEPVKGLMTFLEAAANLARSRPTLRFAVFGEGSQRRELEQHALQLGIGDRVAFPGHVDQAQALRRLAVLALPSIIETAPMALLEAMAAGVPVIASRAGGIPEITGENTAVLVRPRDAGGFAAAAARLLDDPGFAATRIAAGRERIAARYTSDGNADRTLSVYRAALEARRRR